MTVKILQQLFERYLNRLYVEIQSYKDEKNIWKTDRQILNSAGNLCLHLVGNLNNYIGKELGNSGYVRNRELEFSLKNIPREQLLQMVKETSEMVQLSLQKLDDQALEKDFPVVVFEQKTSIGYLLTHLVTHLSYHLGQVNYHRRLIGL
jgi:uncharacterized damage-inducible protein DinB